MASESLALCSSVNAGNNCAALPTLLRLPHDGTTLATTLENESLGLRFQEANLSYALSFNDIVFMQLH